MYSVGHKPSGNISSLSFIRTKKMQEGICEYSSPCRPHDSHYIDTDCALYFTHMHAQTCTYMHMYIYSIFQDWHTTCLTHVSVSS